MLSTTTKPVFLFLFIVVASLATAIKDDSAGDDCQVIIAGAGIGGVYTAYRLVVETKRFAGRNVCIFESRPNPGGRILTVKGAVRGFKDYVVDLGAYRYHRSKQRFVTALAESLLNLDYLCYTDPLPENYPQCSSKSAKSRIFTTRGKVFSPAYKVLENYTSEIPYMIPKESQWGTNSSALTSPRDPYAMLLSSTSPIKTIADRWDEFEATTDYEEAMALADEMLKQLASETYKGIPLSKVTLWQLAVAEGFTNEELKFFLDGSGIATHEDIHTSIYVVCQYNIRDIALGLFSIPGPKELATPARVRSGVPRRIGMRAIVDGLLNKCLENGVRLYYNHRVTHIEKIPYLKGMMKVTVNDDIVIPTGNIFLNMQRLDVISLGVKSEPLKSGSKQFLKSFDNTVPITLSKMYCFWEDAWWITKLNYTRGTYRLADGTLFTGRYHDGDVTCNADQTKCRGALLVSYISGSTVTNAKSGLTLHTFNPRKYQPWRSDVQGNARVIYNEGHNSLLFEDVHSQLRNSHKVDFQRAGLEVEKDLPDAEGCVYADWMDMGMHFSLGPIGPYINPFRQFAKPVSGYNISLVNEAWSDFTGWSEGSIRTAERALFHVHKLPKPTWLDEPYHHSLIRKYNRG